MAGYRRPNLKLVFDDSNGDLSGLVVRIRRPTMDHTLRIAELQDLSGSDRMSERGRQLIDDTFEIIGGLLVDWNLEEDDGTPVPATADGLRAQDIDLFWGLVSAWMDVAVKVRAPLPQPSTGGQPLEEVSIPMETLLGVPASLSVPS